MKIAIYCGNSWEEWSPKATEQGRGGSEEAVIELSKHLAKTHQVTVFNRCGDDEGEHDGVKYANYEYFEGDFDHIILWRSPEPLLKELKESKGKKILWLHDTNPEYDILPFIHLLDKIVVQSSYHASLYPHVPKEKLFVTPLGVNVEYFKQDVKREPYRVIYASSYDRGLKELLESWQEIKLAVPEATLHIYYGWNTMDKMIEAGQEKFKEFKEYIEELMQQDGIVHHGRVGHEELAREYLKASVWAYPCWFPETFCLAGVKAQIAGCSPVVCPTSALRTTVRWGYSTREPRDERGEMPYGTEMKPEMMDRFTDLVIKALSDTSDREAMKSDAIKNFSSEAMAENWSKMLEEL